MVAAVADSLEFEHKYRSIVIAWAPEDRPTDAQINAVLDEFEKTAWAGLEPSATRGRRSCTASTAAASTSSRPVRPGDGQEPEHRAARLAEDLRPAARRLQPRARLEPARRPGAGEDAATRPPRLHRGGEAAGRAGARGRPAPADPGLPGPARRARRRAEPRRRRLRARRRRTRGPRQGRVYVTARDPESGKRWRLKGALYEHDFNPERVDLPAPPPAGSGAPGDRGDRSERAAAARRELERRRRRRAAYHRSRYGVGGRTAEHPATTRVAPAAGGRAEPFARHLRRELGGDALAVDDHRAADRGAGGAPCGHQGGPRDAGRGSRTRRGG